MSATDNDDSPESTPRSVCEDAGGRGADDGLGRARLAVNLDG